MNPDSSHPDSLPHSDEAEQAVLASLLLDPRRIPEVREILPAEAFYSHRNARVYRGMLEVHDSGKPADIVLLHDHLREKWDFEGPACDVYLRGLLDEVPLSVNATQYAKVVVEGLQRREAVSAGTMLQELAREPGGLEAAASYARSFAEAVERTRRSEEPRKISFVGILAGVDPPIPWLIEGWLAEEEIAQFAGEWGSGKSYVALDLAISAAAGIPWLGKVPVVQCPVLYVDEENTEHTARRRIRRILRGRGLSEDQASALPITFMHRNGLRLGRGAKGLATLRREIEKSGAKLVILDSLIRFLTVDENDNTAVAEFYDSTIKRLSAELGVSFVVLDHMRKPGEKDDEQDPGHRMRGAGDKAGIADEIWTLRTNGTRDTKTPRTLSASKARAGDALAPSLRLIYRASEDGQSVWFEASEEEPQDAQALVIGILAGSGATGLRAGDLVDHLEVRGINGRTALRAIKRACLAGDVKRGKEGKGVRYWTRANAPLVTD